MAVGVEVVVIIAEGRSTPKSRWTRRASRESWVRLLFLCPARLALGNESLISSHPGSAAVSESQKEIIDRVTGFVRENLPGLPASAAAQLQFPNSLTSQRDRRFLSDLADALKLYVTYDEFNDDDENVITVKFDEALIEFAREDDDDDEIKGPLDGASDEDSTSSSEAEEIGIVHLSLKDTKSKSATSTPATNGAGTPTGADQPEWKRAVERVLGRYERAEVIRELSKEESEAEIEQQLLAKMDEWKKTYYRVRFSLSSALTSREPRAHLLRPERAGEARVCSRRPEGGRAARLPIHRGPAVGPALLLRRRRFLGMVLRLPLCAEDDR